LANPVIGSRAKGRSNPALLRCAPAAPLKIAGNREVVPMRGTIRKTFITDILALVLGLAGTSQAQAPSLAKQRTITKDGKSFMLTSRLKSILIGDFFYSFDHHSQNAPQNLSLTLQRLGQAEGWTVEVITNAQAVTTAELKDHQVFFANYVSQWGANSYFPSENRTAVQDFVENQGGGVFLQHASGDTRVPINWPFYSVMHPVEYIGDSRRINVSAPVFIPQAAKTHPVMEGINFAGKDTVIWPQGEWQMFNHIITDVQPAAAVLLKMDGAKCTERGTGTNCGKPFNYSIPEGYPVSWTFPVKKGTIGFFMEAHDLITMQAMTQPVWDRFYKQFMYHMAGYDTVEVTTGLARGAKDSEFAVDPSGVTFHSTDPAGVFINKAGRHVVSLYDMQGNKVKEIRGDKFPVDYDLSGELKNARGGVYVMRVALAGGMVRSKRIFVN
jgi:hypothetical protein